jgi:hypothetical protein
MEQRMSTTHAAWTIAAVVMGLSGPAAVVSQDKIAELPTSPSVFALGTTVTGCVAQGTTANTYILTNVIRDGDATAKQRVKPETLLLSGSDIDMSKHVGHKVSVTGVDAAATLPIGTTGALEIIKPTAESTVAKDAKVPAGFTVRSLKMISSSCSEAGN